MSLKSIAVIRIDSIIIIEVSDKRDSNLRTKIAVKQNLKVMLRINESQ